MNRPNTTPPIADAVADADLRGQVALITGANTGIGRVTARTLASRGARVFLAGLSQQRTQPVLDEIRALPGSDAAQWLPLDLGDLGSVRACADAFLKLNLPLHLLINNAGLAGARGLSASGFEKVFGVNHMGHFLLTLCLLPRLRSSGPARVVTVASRAHRMATQWDWEALQRPTQTLTGIREYGVSKLANIWFSAELGRRLQGQGVTSYALHPGVVATDVWRAVPMPFRHLLKLRGMITPQEGAQTTLYCATSARCADETSLYYDRCHPVLPTLLGQDQQLAQALWERSEAWVRSHLNP
jgi:dehydrogenase/reductase SDR family protein 13